MPICRSPSEIRDCAIGESVRRTVPLIHAVWTSTASPGALAATLPPVRVETPSASASPFGAPTLGDASDTIHTLADKLA